MAQRPGAGAHPLPCPPAPHSTERCCFMASWNSPGLPPRRSPVIIVGEPGHADRPPRRRVRRSNRSRRARVHLRLPGRRTDRPPAPALPPRERREGDLMRKASPWFLSAVLGLILGASPCQGQDPPRSPTRATPATAPASKVLRVVDGDTV